MMTIFDWIKRVFARQEKETQREIMEPQKTETPTARQALRTATPGKPLPRMVPDGVCLYPVDARPLPERSAPYEPPPPAFEVQFMFGDYSDRQRDAAQWGADIYIEQHFNAFTTAEPNYSMCVVGPDLDANKNSIDLAEKYLGKVRARIGVRPSIAWPRGVRVGGRGGGNVANGAPTAVLLEPLFISNPEGAAVAASADGREQLARALVDAITAFCAERRAEFGKQTIRVAFSVGHKYKATRPNDRGVPLGGGLMADSVQRHTLADLSTPAATEADLAESVLLIAKSLLQAEMLGK